MKVYALVGKSGTGKSHHSMWVACENQLDFIIDDGLLISNNRIIAGKSAKREANKIASVYCAIFNDPSHADEVKKALKENNVQSLLIIGTSEKMVNRIADALSVAPIDKIIHIEDVTTPEERQIAFDMRNKHGKHVIPVPAFELKRQFSGYFTAPMTLFFKKKGQTIAEEKTIMRPAYSYLGDYKLSPKVITDICTVEALKFPSVHKILKIKDAMTSNGFLNISVDISVNFPCRVNEQMKLISAQIKKSIEEFTGITVSKITVNAKDLHIGGKS